jgi:hypothetical protein
MSGKQLVRKLLSAVIFLLFVMCYNFFEQFSDGLHDSTPYGRMNDAGIMHDVLYRMHDIRCLMPIARRLMRVGRSAGFRSGSKGKKINLSETMCRSDGHIKWLVL